MRSVTRRRAPVAEVGGQDLVIVVGGGGEGAPAIDVADRPDARNVGAKLIVDGDETPPVGLDTGLIEPEIVGVGNPPDGEQQVGADDLVGPRFASRGEHHPIAAFLDAYTLGIETHLDAFRLQDLLHRGRDILVVAGDQAISHLDDGDAASEAAIHLGELQADIAAADDHQVLGQEVDLHH